MNTYRVYPNDSDRIEAMSDFDRRQALHFLSGFDPDAVHAALAEHDRQVTYSAERKHEREDMNMVAPSFYRQ